MHHLPWGRLHFTHDVIQADSEICDILLSLPQKGLSSWRKPICSCDEAHNISSCGHIKTIYLCPKFWTENLSRVTNSIIKFTFCMMHSQGNVNRFQSKVKAWRPAVTQLLLSYVYVGLHNRRVFHENNMNVWLCSLSNYMASFNKKRILVIS